MWFLSRFSRSTLPACYTYSHIDDVHPVHHETISYKGMACNDYRIFSSVLFLSVIKFWNHELLAFWREFFNRLSGRTPNMVMPEYLPIQILAGVLIFILLLSWLRLRANYYKNIIRVRTYQQILFFAFLLGIFSIYLSRDLAYIHFVIFAIPLSLWFSYFFVSQKKRLFLTECLLWVLIGSIIWNHIA